MKGKITLNLATSIDGFIADLDGGYAWIAGQGDKSLDTEKEFPFGDFVSSIDVVVMGHESYLQGFAKDYQAKTVYVATSKAYEDTENLKFIGGDIVTPVLAARDAGKNVYLFGGGITIAPFIQANVIDAYHIGIVPIILGKGRPLFLGNTPPVPLLLQDYCIRDGITELHYIKK